jgi:hypothetical protein
MNGPGADAGRSVAMTGAEGEEAVRAFLVPTAAGAWFCTDSRQFEPQRAVLAGLLRGDGDKLTLTRLASLTGVDNPKSLRALLFKMQRDGLVTADTEPLACPTTSLDQARAHLLPDLSNTGRCVLADAAGLCVVYAGFDRPAAECCAAVAVESYRAYHRYQSDLARALGEAPHAWSTVGSTPDSSLLVTHLYIGECIFYLIVSGAPRLESLAAVGLIALLNREYGART